MKRNTVALLLLCVIVILVSTSACAQSCETALLVIDVQSNILAFGAQNMQTIFNQTILERVEQIVGEVRSAGLPIIYLKFVPEAFAANPEMIRISQSIAPMESDPVLWRLDPDPFVESELDALLDERGITQLLLCGIYSTCCVDTAIRSSTELGYRVIVIEDGHGDHVNNLSAARDIQAEWEAMSSVSIRKLAELDLTALCHP